jgi:hypothetical protein
MGVLEQQQQSAAAAAAAVTNNSMMCGADGTVLPQAPEGAQQGNVAWTRPQHQQ